MPRALFVCTGNAFRSLTAEFALRKALGTSGGIIVASAGTADIQFAVRPFVADYLFSRSADDGLVAESLGNFDAAAYQRQIVHGPDCKSSRIRCQARSHES
jgi:protein-tyrosine-phosphatase